MELKLSEMILRLESDSPPTQREIETEYRTLIDDALGRMEGSTQEPSVFEGLVGTLENLRSDLRESVQALTRKEMWRIIQKLRTEETLNGDELALVRLWVIGDAAAYIHEEKHFDDWVEEFRRLATEIRKLRDAPLEIEWLEHLQGLLKDASGVARRISVFLIDRDRVQKFETRLNEGLDESARENLAALLVRSYESPRY